MLGFLFVAAVVVAIVMVGFRMLPVVYRVLLRQKGDGKIACRTPRSRFRWRNAAVTSIKSSADYIDSVRGTDIDVAKDGNALVATVDVDAASCTWSATLSLLLEFGRPRAQQADALRGR